jgi:CelD/BcsL family acetyltransferase involved in cellulose biosynthesis
MQLFSSNGSPSHGEKKQSRGSKAIALEILDPTRDERWDCLAKTHPDCLPFHCAGWARVLERTYGHAPVYLRFHRDDETVALIPMMEVRSPFTGRRGVSLPFSDFCQPLIWNHIEPSELFAVLSCLAARRSWKYCELRVLAKTPNNTSGREFYHHSIRLAKTDAETWQQFASSVQRAIRRGAKEGAHAEITSSWTAMLDFYNLHVATRRRHGVPPQGKAFFRHIHEEMIQKGDGFLTIVRSGRQPVAASVFLISGQTAVYKFAASDEKHQRCRGNNLAIWEAIKFLVGRNCQTLDFGRTDQTDSGLRRFKLSWGAKEDGILHVRCGSQGDPENPPARSRGELHKKIFSKLPLAVNRVAGAAIYPHLD